MIGIRIRSLCALRPTSRFAVYVCVCVCALVRSAGRSFKSYFQESDPGGGRVAAAKPGSDIHRGRGGLPALGVVDPSLLRLRGGAKMPMLHVFWCGSARPVPNRTYGLGASRNQHVRHGASATIAPMVPRVAQLCAGPGRPDRIVFLQRALGASPPERSQFQLRHSRLCRSTKEGRRVEHLRRSIVMSAHDAAPIMLSEVRARMCLEFGRLSAPPRPAPPGAAGSPSATPGRAPS